MTNQEIANILEEIGTLLELQGDNPFKCRAYHNAARIIEGLTADVLQLINRNELRETKGIGQGLAEKIEELAATGKLKFHDDLKRAVPSGLMEMLRIPGLGPKRVKILFDTLKIKSIDQLRKACERHALEGIAGFGKKTEDNIVRGIEMLEKHSDQHLYSTAKAAADEILSAIAGLKYVFQCDMAGSLRRKKEVIGDIDILASVDRKKAADVMTMFTSHPNVAEIVARGETKSTVLLHSGIRCDLRVIDKIEYPFALAYFTGSKEHNVQMRSLAKKFGWTLNEYGFSHLGDTETRGKAKRVIRCRTEKEIFRSLKLQYIPPELRENMDEIEAAATDSIPTLIEEEDIRGTFHCHTNFSDGQNSLEEMATAAQELGWEYIGIADHSKAAAYAGGLSAEKVKQQHKEIDTLNLRSKGIRIFKGTEVDILTDGRLDWNDSVLKSFDFVVASVHSNFKMTEPEMTKRIIKAIKNKYVTMLGHPTGRLLLQRDPYPVNMIEVINAASDYGTIIEINSHPNRLDLDWRLCKYARDKGVKISINPDAHTIKGLKDVRYGVGIARKGWLAKSDVINTYRVSDVTKFLNSSH